jgi:hypothetical protein
MRPSDRALLVAAAASAALHLAALFGVPQFDFGARREDLPELPPIEARLIPPEPPAPVVTPPPRAVRAAPARPRARRAAPPPRPVVQAAVVPQYDDAEPGVAAAGDGPSGLEAPGEPMEAAAEAPATEVAAPEPRAEYPVRHARLVFDLYYGAYPTKVGEVTHTWAQDGRAYQVETVAEAVGFASLFVGGRLVQRASGLFTAGGLVPTAYQAELGTPDRVEEARFDWVEHKLALASKGERRLVDLPAGAQDPLSMLHQLYFMKPIPTPARLDIATGRKLYEQTYRVIGETQIQTPLGLLRTLQLSRRDSDGETMDVWLDLDRDLLPAKIHFVNRRGMVLEQVIREARLDLAAAAQ